MPFLLPVVCLLLFPNIVEYKFVSGKDRKGIACTSVSKTHVEELLVASKVSVRGSLGERNVENCC